MADQQHQYGQMPTQFSSLPEVADYSTNAPEVVAHDYTQKPATVTAGNHYYSPPQDASRAGTAVYSPPAHGQEPKDYDRAVTTVAAVQPSPPESSPTSSPGPNKKVTILSILVGILAVVVVALAATTGLLTQKANDKDAQIARMDAQLRSLGGLSSSSDGVNGAAAAEKETATVTVIAPSPAETGSSGSVVSASTSAFLVEDVSNGCNDKSETITGTDYTTKLYGKVTFRRYCNQKTISDPIYAMHTPDFETCLEACASWSQALPSIFSGVSDRIRANVTCSAVNFVPKWTDKNESSKRQARGNCYLKSGEQTEEKSLKASGSDPVGHSAIVIKQAAKKD